MAIAGTRNGIAAIVMLFYLKRPVKDLGKIKLQCEKGKMIVNSKSFCLFIY